MDTHPTTGAPGRAPGRPPVEAVDRDRSRRPGVPKERPPQPWPNSRPEPQRMTGRPATPRHGRPGKRMPPVYSTANPPRGVSGLVRRAASRLPDHDPRHWLMLLLADRVQLWGRRVRRLAWVAAPVAIVLLARRGLAGRA